MKRVSIMVAVIAASVFWLVTNLTSQAQACMYCNLTFWLDYILGPFGTIL